MPQPAPPPSSTVSPTERPDARAPTEERGGLGPLPAGWFRDGSDFRRNAARYGEPIALVVSFAHVVEQWEKRTGSSELSTAAIRLHGDFHGRIRGSRTAMADLDAWVDGP